jgi:hypothetical protein
MNVYLFKVDMSADGVKDAGRWGGLEVEQLFRGRPDGYSVYMLDAGSGTAIYVAGETIARLGFRFANTDGRDAKRQFLYVSGELHNEAVNASTRAALHRSLQHVDLD